jgi:hypothetical protein
MTNTNVYSAHKKESVLHKAAYNTRKKIYKILSDEINLEEIQTIIDVGVTADREIISSNFFENLYPHHERITAFSDQDASWMEECYPGIKFQQGTALNMPFNDNTFDLVFSSAVLEHVGNIKNQKKFIEECMRISKQYVFITTPNRFYPIELHTALPFIHWLPKRIHRKILKTIGFDYLSLEENLNLLTKKDLNKICEEHKAETRGGGGA